MTDDVPLGETNTDWL